MKKYPYIKIFQKDIFEVWQTPQLLKMIKGDWLKHENDGLIFTVDNCPYYPGTCPEITKWKPAHLNTIDFQIEPLEDVEGTQIYGLYVF